MLPCSFFREKRLLATRQKNVFSAHSKGFRVKNKTRLPHLTLRHMFACSNRHPKSWFLTFNMPTEASKVRLFIGFLPFFEYRMIGLWGEVCPDVHSWEGCAISTYLKAWECKTDRTSAFIEVILLSDDQSIICIPFTAPGCYLYSLFVWCSKGALTFPQDCIESCGNVLFPSQKACRPHLLLYLVSVFAELWVFGLVSDSEWVIAQ